MPCTGAGFALAMVVALFMALVQYANIKVLKQFARFYIWIFRGTPLLVQLFLAYFGLPKLGIVMDAFPCALLVLGLNEGAYCAETLRSALESVSEGQIEAVMEHITAENYANMRERVCNLETRDTVTGMT